MKYLLSVILLLIIIFRVWNIGILPNGFGWDEMDNAYQAYSLLRTGKDLYGNPLPVLLHAFADHKSSLYIYMTTPFVKVMGMTATAARLPAAIFGIVALAMIIYICGKIWGIKWGIVAGIIMGMSPWWFSYSRLSFEAVGMLALFLVGFAAWEKSSVTPKYLIWTGIFWGLSIWTYSTAKLFIPLFGLIALVLNYKRIINTNKRILITAAVITIIISMPPLWQSFFGKGNTRFNEISIFTDPTIKSEVNFALEEGQVSSGIPKEVGMTPRLLDRLAHNKYQFQLNKLVTNYLTAFSSDFLFIKGDPNLRQSPGKDSVGQFLVVDALLIILGLTWFFQKENRLLLLWLIIAPLSSIVTRDGGNHATRLLFMLPVIVMISTAGMRNLAKHKFSMLIFSSFYVYYIFVFGYFYFTHYRFESQIPFHNGFLKVAQLALDNSSKFDQVIIDLHHESALMVYLVQSDYDPKLLHSQMPLVQREVIPGINANKFGNIYILGPGERGWDDYYHNNKIPPSTLIILSADTIPQIPISETIYYEDGQKAFYVSQFSK